ncbi:MAG: Nif3-like dinuclear metal center hexameric protein [Porphyromonas sp.]|nr:Nif3-like dinuclear metal center hexameric protein [Porphyromonas sp.]
MKVADIAFCLEAAFPLAFQESYDNCGLQVGNLEAEVSGVLLAIDVDEAVLAEAVERGCNLVVTHHPLLFRALKRISNETYIERCVSYALRYGLHIYAAHTCADNAFPGINTVLADRLGLLHCRPLFPMEGKLYKLVTYIPEESADHLRQALWANGAGQIGAYDCCSYNVEGCGTFRPLEGAHPYIGEVNSLSHQKEVCVSMVFPSHSQTRILHALKKAHPYEEPAFDLIPLANRWETQGGGLIGELPGAMPMDRCLAMLKQKLQAECLCYSRSVESKRSIRRIALCGGAGAFMYGRARAQQADLFLTGEAKYNDFYDAMDGPPLVTIGHYETERYAVDLFRDTLSQKFRNFAFHTSVRMSNPVKYL